MSEHERAYDPTWSGDDEVDEESQRLELMRICGCGLPEKCEEFLARVFVAPKSWTGLSPMHTSEQWVDAVKADPTAAAELLMHWAEALELLEHGSSRPGWQTVIGNELGLALHGQPEGYTIEAPDAEEGT